MKENVREIFRDENIEYVSAIAYSDCREINAKIVERDGFLPKSVLVFLLPYYTGETVNISRYAASVDYHIIIKSIGARITERLRALYPKNEFRAYGDHSPINEVSAALLCGLGCMGDNGLIINEKYGSYVFIGDIITDIEPSELECMAPVPTVRCEGCGACKAVCPTGILRGEGDSCLSAVTQRRGELTEQERALMRKCGTAWGCDLCQSSCPHNMCPTLTPLREFYEDRIEKLTTELLNSMDKSALSRRAFAWRGRSVLLRNLEILDM